MFPKGPIHQGFVRKILSNLISNEALFDVNNKTGLGEMGNTHVLKD